MSTAGLDDIAAKVAEGHALTDADAEALASTYDIVSLGMVADDAAPGAARHADDVPARGTRAGRGGTRPAGSVAAIRARGARGCSVRRHREARAAVRRAVSGGRSGRWSAGSRSRTSSRPRTATSRGCARGSMPCATRVSRLIDEAPVDVLRQPAALLQAAEASGLPVARVTVHAGPPDGPLPLIRLVASLQAETNAVRVFAPMPRQPGRRADDGVRRRQGGRACADPAAARPAHPGRLDAARAEAGAGGAHLRR